ncbi:protocadherin beta-14-like, partial [Triplophysa rosa]|uniref:protocadherin beta-14-like n=1 Tax=Triplophysa rosa TaxID=992332 RepID=UPI0025461167
MVFSKMSDRTMAGQVLLVIWFLSLGSALGQVSYSIPEEMAKGSLVGSIVHDLGLDLKRLKSGKARVYTGDSAEYIELNKDRGVLLIKERIDREALCGQTTPCALHLQIILENPIEFYSVNVEITDVNDHSPSFKRDEMIFRISESAVTGAVFDLERAMDLDVGNNGLQTYSLKPTDNFLLKLQTQSDGSKLVEMVLQKPLDREKQEHLSLVLTAIDGGDPQLSGTAQILITVLDVNDNAPVFTQKIYKASITENALKGTVFTTVSASDMDEGSHGKIKYLITNTLDPVTELFKINEESGEVTVTGVIDYEKARHYQIHVQAADDGGLTDSCKIGVDVIDVNDNKPLINIMSKLTIILENSSSSTVVTVINVQDPDSGENGKIQCSINENIPFTLTSTSNNFFSLVTDGELDRERESQHKISVTCADEGVPSLSSSITLSLQISDVNDNAPVFEKSSYDASFLSLGSALGQVSYSIPEEMAKGSLVGNIAQDLGLDLKRLKSGKARIYTGDSAEYIELNKDKGVLLIKERIDREALCGQTTPCALHLQIIFDNPMELFRVTIEITDINDNSPIFKRNERRFDISESAVVGSKFMLEKAIDADIGANGLQSYFLQPTDHFNLKLHGQSDGSKKVEMILQKPLDREKQENMSLVLTAMDGGDPPKSGTVQIHITVIDANDNAPVFTKPMYRAIISENSEEGKSVISVSASDSDKGANGEVGYLIANSDGVSDFFQIDENGLVTLVGKLDFETSKHYQIDIEAVDNGGLSDSSKIIIDVIDVNDNAPVISAMSKSTAIPEDSPQSTVIAIVSVNDPDSDSNGQVQCIVNENIPFTIKSTSNGFYSIVTDGDLDREGES